jgi:hypothetical protein
VCGFPPETCSDGILNQDETAIDKGGICFYVSLNWPENATTVPDFAKWTVAYYGNDANSTSPTLQKAVMWSDNATLLATCLNFPSDTATYDVCFGGSNVIHIDYGLPVWISMADYVSYLDKTGTMLAGKTYYARALLYSINDTDLTRVAMVSYSDVIHFSIDNAVGGSGGACEKGDIWCILMALLKSVFVPSDASLLQFGDFKNLLTSKAPFGYAIAVYNEVTTIHYDANADVFELQQVTPITNLIFAPIRAGLAWFLWFAFAFFLIKRFKDINI